MTLLELQRTMSAAVMLRLTPDFRMQQKTVDGRPMSTHAASFIKPSGQVNSFERLEIYNRQYWFRVLSNFANDYPGLRAVLGERRFDALSVAYLADNPSSSYTLRNLGSCLVSWLRQNPKWAGKRLALVLDIARLEWAYVEAFDNAEHRSLTSADLSHCSAESHLALQPHVRLLQLSYPVDDFIIAVHRAQPETSVASNAVAEGVRSRSRRISPINPEAVFLAVHRFDYSVYYKRLEREAYATLLAVANGESLGDALSKGFEGSKIPALEQPSRVQEWFATWAELGWFCGDSLESRPQ